MSDAREEFDAVLAARPVDHSGPLPLRVTGDGSTIRPGAIGYYAQAEDGSGLVLKAIPGNDKASLAAHWERVLSGDLTIVQPGQALPDDGAAERQRLERQALVNGEIAKLEQERIAQAQAAAQRRAADALAKAQAEVERIKQSYRRP